MILEGHGLAMELGSGWSGRIFARAHGVATLHASNYGLVLDDGEFGDGSTKTMPAGGIFIALTEYRPGRGLEPGNGLFAPSQVPRRLDPTRFSHRGLAHPRAGQVGVQHFFTVSGRPFCVYVVLAGGRGHRARQLAAVERLLATLRIAPRVPLIG